MLIPSKSNRTKLNFCSHKESEEKRRKMNSFKKIAIATVAALSMTTILATSASAATTLTVGGSSVATGLVSSNPVVLTVPADNKVDLADVLRFSFTGLDTGTIVSAVATNASIVTAVHSDTAPVPASSGTGSISINTGTGTSADFYVFTKTVNSGTVVVTVGGTTVTYYVKGSAGPAYNLSLVAADTANISTVNKVYVKTTDAFGNPVITSTPTITVIGATAGAVSVSDTATGTFVFDLTAPSTTGNAAFTSAISATDVVGLAAAVKSSTKFIAITSVADALAVANSQIAKLTAELAAEKTARSADAASAKATADLSAAQIASAKVAADLAKSTYIAEYNVLAKKWNAKNPKAKVALKK